MKKKTGRSCRRKEPFVHPIFSSLSPHPLLTKEAFIMTYQMLLLYTAPDNFTAEILMAALRENNIPAVKRDLGAAGLLNLYQGNSFEGEQIFVAPEAFERAKELLLVMGFAQAEE
jgi:hypothetical protein